MFVFSVFRGLIQYFTKYFVSVKKVLPLKIKYFYVHFKVKHCFFKNSKTFFNGKILQKAQCFAVYEGKLLPLFNGIVLVTTATIISP